MVTCSQTRDNLSRFLDNDLDGRTATALAEHMSRCAGCRNAYEDMGRVRTILRGLTPPVSGDSVRERVFARLERAAYAKTEKPRRVWSLSLPSLAWHPLTVTLAAAAAAAGTWYLMPSTVVAPPHAVTLAAALPNDGEITRLDRLHDVQTAGLSDEEPIARRDAIAEAHAALLSDADAAVTGSL